MKPTMHGTSITRDPESGRGSVSRSFGIPFRATASTGPTTRPLRCCSTPTEPWTRGSERTTWTGSTARTSFSPVPADWFHVTAITNLPPWTSYFDSSTNRVYTLFRCTNLVEGVWTNVPGTGPRTGAGDGDSMGDASPPAETPFYRVEVELP